MVAILKILLIAVVLTLIAVAALSVRLFFKKESNLQGTCSPRYADGSGTGDAGCGCGSCGCAVED